MIRRTNKPPLSISSFVNLLIEEGIGFTDLEIRKAQSSRIVCDASAPYFKSLVRDYQNCIIYGENEGSMKIISDKVKKLLTL